MKYIVLEENVNSRDVDAYVDLCAEIGVTEFSISPDTYSDPDTQPREIIDGVIRLQARAEKKGIRAVILPGFNAENMRIFTKAAATKFSVS